LLVLLALAAGCSSRSAVPSGDATATPTPAPETALDFSYISAGDLRARPQLLSGWYDIEEGAWRWIGKDAEAVLAVPRQAPLEFELQLFFPPGHMNKAGGPVTVSVLLDGRLFAEQAYSQPGAYTMAQPAPAGLLASPSVKVSIRLDRAVPPTAADERELGAVVRSFGFRR
jgi:hypothetical protein